VPWSEAVLLKANANWLLSNIPIAVPTAIVIAKPIPNVTSFGCADIVFRSLCFMDMLERWQDTVYLNLD
jgi:hypothetical protein